MIGIENPKTVRIGYSECEFVKTKKKENKE